MTPMTEPARESAAMPLRLDGKTALITGASQGIGAAIALAMSAAGADIAILGRSDPHQTAKEISALGRRHMVIRQDLADLGPDEADTIIHEVTAHLNGLDILINNAGVFPCEAACEHGADSFLEAMQINAIAPWWLAQSCGRHMTAVGGGRIINIASNRGLTGGAGHVAYNMSKHALIGMTRALAAEWAPAGINVNAIAPGHTDTPLLAHRDKAYFDHLAAQIPARRIATPRDIAAVAVFLASPASEYIHGAVIPVDGGRLIAA